MHVERSKIDCGDLQKRGPLPWGGWENICLNPGNTTLPGLGPSTGGGSKIGHISIWSGKTGYGNNWAPSLKWSGNIWAPKLWKIGLEKTGWYFDLETWCWMTIKWEPENLAKSSVPHHRGISPATWCSPLGHLPNALLPLHQSGCLKETMAESRERGTTRNVIIFLKKKL